MPAINIEDLSEKDKLKMEVEQLRKEAKLQRQPVSAYLVELFPRFWNSSHFSGRSVSTRFLEDGKGEEKRHVHG